MGNCCQNDWMLTSQDKKLIGRFSLKMMTVKTVRFNKYTQGCVLLCFETGEFHSYNSWLLHLSWYPSKAKPNSVYILYIKTYSIVCGLCRLHLTSSLTFSGICEVYDIYVILDHTIPLFRRLIFFRMIRHMFEFAIISPYEDGVGSWEMSLSLSNL